MSTCQSVLSHTRSCISEPMLSMEGMSCYFQLVFISFMRLHLTHRGVENCTCKNLLVFIDEAQHLGDRQLSVVSVS